MRSGRGFTIMAVVGAFTLGILTATTVNALSSAESRETGSPVVQDTPTVTTVSDDPGDGEGLREGNHVARVDGLLLFNLDSLTGNPYVDCVTLLDLWELSGRDRAGFASVELCEPVYLNR